MNYTIEPMLTSEEISAKVLELAAQIDADYQGETVILVGLLRGSAIFIADLARALKTDAMFDFMVVTSYGNSTETSRDVRIIKDLEEDIFEKHVILVEDIIDTGYTLKKVTEILATREPKSLRICTLLDKPTRREVSVPCHYTGFQIPDEFVVGYGIDYAQKHRTLPFIGHVKFKQAEEV